MTLKLGIPLTLGIPRLACDRPLARIQFWHMSNTFTVRLPEQLAQWLRDVARRRGVSKSQIIKDNLEKARQEAPDKPFMKLAGSIEGLPRNSSQRKGYSRS